MKKVLFSLAGMCLFPLAAHATLQSMTFDLLNDPASVAHPISVTDGYVLYPVTPVCNLQPTVIGLSQLATLPLQVKVDTETSISVPVTPDLVSCLQNPNEIVQVFLYITSVDGKTKKGDSQCIANMNLYSSTVNAVSTLKIQETKDTFNCVQAQAQ